MDQRLDPDFISLSRLTDTLRERGHAALTPLSVFDLAQSAPQEFDALRASWDRLPPDPHLKDGGRYRRRRHSSFVIAADGSMRQVPHRAHWQPVSYNALHGGLERWFEPIEPEVVTAPAWSRWLVALAGVCSSVTQVQPWYVEAHQFRIDTTDGIGRPTPEGAHRDGVDFVAVSLVDRHGVKGGETRVFEAAGPHGQRFTLTAPWTTLLLDDHRVIHESTPIQPVEAEGHRDTLVLTFRSKGFQDPPA